MRALITGCSGQDGSYLTELLLSKGYEVYGLLRRVSSRDNSNLDDVLGHKRFHFVSGDMTDFPSLYKAVEKAKPDEVYNLAAQSFVGESWTYPLSTYDINALGTARILEVCRLLVPKVKFYQAGTSEMFGNATESPQNENTPFNPRSPYGISKLAAYHMTKNYRESFQMFAVNGVLFNHESPRRGDEFVTKKIVNAAKTTGKVVLGNTDARRDWGHARDYVRAMWLMLQQKEAEDFVIATGKTHSIGDFINEVRKYQPLEYTISGEFIRPSDIYELRGDSRKAKKKLGWEPAVGFEELVWEMMHDN